MCFSFLFLIIFCFFGAIPLLFCAVLFLCCSTHNHAIPLPFCSLLCFSFASRCYSFPLQHPTLQLLTLQLHCDSLPRFSFAKSVISSRCVSFAFRRSALIAMRFPCFSLLSHSFAEHCQASLSHCTPLPGITFPLQVCAALFPCHTYLRILQTFSLNRK